jgi:hypothetical protein
VGQWGGKERLAGGSHVDFFFEFVQCRQSQRLKFKEKIGSVLYKSHFFVAIDQDVKYKVPFGLGFTVGTEWELKYLG